MMTTGNKSTKSHWEGVMDIKTKAIISAVDSFPKQDLYKIFYKYIPYGDNDKTFFEIGAAPGLYPIVFDKYFGYKGSGIEYTKIGYQSIKKVYNELEINSEGFIHGDFFAHNRTQKYDIVFSGGFIEHFDNYKDVIMRHFNITKRGGKIIILVPNYHFYFKYMQELFYPGLMSIQHNTAIMSISSITTIFKEFESQGLVKIEFIGLSGIAGLGQLACKNKFLQKLIYAIDFFLQKLGIYKIIPRQYSTIVVVMEKK